MGKGQNRSKIKAPEANKGAHLIALKTQDYNKIPVIFSLRHIQNGKYCFSQLDQKQKSDFAEALFRRKDFTWNDYHQIPKESLGYELLPFCCLKIASKPICVTEDLDKVIVIRFSGNDGRIVGFREKNIYYVLWVDCCFELYDHGS